MANNSFKPNLLRSSKSVAEKACHAFASTTQVGLTQAFGSDTAALARQMLAGGLRTEPYCVDTRQLDPRFAGQPFDPALLDALPPGVDRCGENGEFHTCV